MSSLAQDLAAALKTLAKTAATEATQAEFDQLTAVINKLSSDEADLAGSLSAQGNAAADMEARLEKIEKDYVTTEQLVSAIASGLSGAAGAAATQVETDLTAAVTGTDTTTSGAGNDTIVASAGTDTISAPAEADTVTSGTGSDTLTASADNSTITGGAGNDTIDTGAGNDTIEGGAA